MLTEQEGVTMVTEDTPDHTNYVIQLFRDI